MGPVAARARPARGKTWIRLLLVAARQQLEWHERVRRALDFKVDQPDFVVWIVVEADGGASLDEDALRQDVEGWLGRLDADRVFEERDEPVHTWEAGGLLVRFTAVPKKPEARGTGVPIVGNPLSPAAYGSGFVRSGTGVPVLSAEPSPRPPRPSRPS